MSESGDAVVVAFIFGEHTSGWFTYSLADMLRYDAQRGQHITRPEGGIITISSGPRIAEARNMVVDQFAENHPSADWLLTIDADMTWEPNLVEEMLKIADPKGVPVLGALCFAGGRESAPYPTIWKENPPKPGDEQQNWFFNIEKVRDYPRNALLQVAGTGAACMLIHRNVFAALKRPYPKGFGTLPDGRENTYPWYAEGLVGPAGYPLGEDISFCRKCRLAGIPVHVHTGIKTGHMKTYEINEQRYLAGRRLDAVTNGDRPANRAERRQAARAKVKA